MYNKIIKSDDNKALTQLMENKDFFVKRNEYMQSVNDYYKENGTVVGFPDMEDDTAKNLNARVSKENPYGKFELITSSFKPSCPLSRYRPGLQRHFSHRGRRCQKAG